MIILAADPGGEKTAVSWVEPIRPGRVRHLGKAMVPSTAEGFAGILAEVSPSLVVVERASGGVFAPYRAKYLLRAQWEGGRLAGLAHQAGIEVLEASAEQWRKAVFGTLKRGQSYDEVIARMLPALVEGLQKGNVHTRDATGLAVWGVMVATQPGSLPFRPQAFLNAAK